MQSDLLGIMVFGHTRIKHLQALLESLELQRADESVHVWLDGHHGKKDLREKVESCASMVIKRYPWAQLHVHGGHIGIEKMTLDGLGFMCDRYERIIILEDDCFPVNGCIQTFSQCLDEIEKRPDVYSVYGHHFLMPEERETITRFQGWGWASTRKKILPVLEQLQVCFDMNEADYLDWVKKTLNPEIERRLNATPPRNCLVPLSMFFCWDACTSLITASQGMVHMKTPRRVIYNCGMGKESTHFQESQILRKPPFNMIHVDEVWSFYHSGFEGDSHKEHNTKGLTALLLSLFNEKDYHLALHVLAQDNAKNVLGVPKQLIAQMISHLGTGNNEIVSNLFQELTLYSGESALADAELATAGCLLVMGKNSELIFFLKDLFSRDNMPNINALPVASGTYTQMAEFSMPIPVDKQGSMGMEEMYYNLGLEMHHTAERFQDVAANIYRNIIDNEGGLKNIRAWACYKYGEICRNTGEGEKARELFKDAVVLVPGHAKARIALQPNNISSVRIGKTPVDNFEPIHVAMDIFDHELWKYYFSGHTIGHLIIDLPSDADAVTIASLEPCFTQFMDPEGAVSFIVQEDRKDLIDELSRSSFLGNGFQLKWTIHHGH